MPGYCGLALGSGGDVLSSFLSSFFFGVAFVNGVLALRAFQLNDEIQLSPVHVIVFAEGLESASQDLHA